MSFLCDDDLKQRMSEQNSLLLKRDFPVINLRMTFLSISSSHLFCFFRLSPHCRNLFFDLGSANVQNLKYRDLWAFLGQKGIKGFSPYEEVCLSLLFEENHLVTHTLSLSRIVMFFK